MIKIKIKLLIKTMSALSATQFLVNWLRYKFSTAPTAPIKKQIEKLMRQLISTLTFDFYICFLLINICHVSLF